VEGCTRDGATAVACGAKGVFVAFSLLGFHAVSVFLVLSGLVLGLSASGRASHDWRAWYRTRLLRLYPMYWLAHLVVLVSPFVFQPEPIDGRLFSSLLGVRLFPIESSFFYLNSAWWYFTLLLQLYFVFPLLWWAHERLGPPLFLAACVVVTLGTRWCLLAVVQTDGLWAQGGFFAARVFEFGAGIVVGAGLRRTPAQTSARLFGPAALAAGAVLYGLGLASYASLVTYTATDALIGAGLFLLLANASRALATLPRVGAAVVQIGAFSYGLYLVHQPYVIEAAIHVRTLSIPLAIACFLPLLVALTGVSMWLERRVNALTNRLLPAG
jgi:peptidoglycan/LPS O-acetylase OafA/YrhL